MFGCLKLIIDVINLQHYQRKAVQKAWLKTFFTSVYWTSSSTGNCLFSLFAFRGHELPVNIPQGHPDNHIRNWDCF